MRLEARVNHLVELHIEGCDDEYDAFVKNDRNARLVKKKKVAVLTDLQATAREALLVSPKEPHRALRTSLARSCRKQPAYSNRHGGQARGAGRRDVLVTLLMATRSDVPAMVVEWWKWCYDDTTGVADSCRDSLLAIPCMTSS